MVRQRMCVHPVYISTVFVESHDTFCYYSAPLYLFVNTLFWRFPDDDFSEYTAYFPLVVFEFCYSITNQIETLVVERLFQKFTISFSYGLKIGVFMRG